MPHLFFRIFFDFFVVEYFTTGVSDGGVDLPRERKDQLPKTGTFFLLAKYRYMVFIGQRQVHGTAACRLQMILFFLSAVPSLAPTPTRSDLSTYNI